ncbi:MAG: DUF362 domain-containing protein [Chthoniobacterales bacterium]
MAFRIEIKHLASPTEFFASVGKVLPLGSFRTIVIKPNWVKHAEHAEFPIEALVTSSQLIEAVIDACLQKYPDVEKITIADVPLQSCDWHTLCAQAGIDKLEAKYTASRKPQIRFLDLRRERYRLQDGFLIKDEEAPGDPLGYAEVRLDERSLLEEVTDSAHLFRVSDYDPGETISSHSRQCHRYLIPKTILEADILINLPKMKTHQKSGVTGALKNLVGINGDKSRLVHHRLGFPDKGGDEFSPDISRIFYWQARLRELLQKRSPSLFAICKKAWEYLKRLRGIKTVGTLENLQSSSFYVGSGSWYGNDSIWRMVYDLHMVLLFTSKEGGKLENTPQRQVFHIMDGVVAGEGNGPLQPLPVQAGVMLASDNPFLIDFSMAKLMGYDWKKIRLLSQYRRFSSAPFVDFDPLTFEVVLDGISSARGVEAIPVIKTFVPPPGWKDHIALTDS